MWGSKRIPRYLALLRHARQKSRSREEMYVASSNVSCRLDQFPTAEASPQRGNPRIYCLSWESPQQKRMDVLDLEALSFNATNICLQGYHISNSLSILNLAIICVTSFSILWASMWHVFRKCYCSRPISLVSPSNSLGILGNHHP